MLVETRKISKGKEVTVVTSLDVAETFGKRHSDVLRDIENLECSPEFRERNFAFSKYSVENNKKNISNGIYDKRWFYHSCYGLYWRESYEI